MQHCILVKLDKKWHGLASIGSNAAAVELYEKGMREMQLTALEVWFVEKGG